MATDNLARALTAQNVRMLSSSAPGMGAALVGMTSGATLQQLGDRIGVPVTGVVQNGDAATAIETAAALAAVLGVDVLLPPWTVTLSRPVRVNRLRGVPGLSRIDVSGCVMGTYPLSQFCIVNEHWATAYSSTTADRCAYAGFEILTTPAKAQSLIGLANVSFVDVDQVTFRANRNLNPSGKPYVVDALLDFYAAVRGGYVRRCRFYQHTGAYGANRVTGGGGGCIWVRNLSANGSLTDNVTERVLIEDCDFSHYTTDEAVAFYGVRGTTRRCHLSKCRVTGLEAADLGLAASESIYRTTLLSIFPLDDGSGANLGNTAAVYENEFCDNEIVDKSTLYNTIRIGNTADAARRCENNRSRRNKVAFKFWSDATNGQVAVWTAAGASGTNPSSANIPIRCIEGTAGTAYSGAISGNVSEDDEVGTYSGSTTITGGFTGWQLVKNGRVRGSISTGALSCPNVGGGTWEVSLRGFSNCNSVSNPYVRINAATSAAHAVFAVDSSLGGNYKLTGALVTGGALAYVASGASASTIVNVQGCTGTLGAFDALTNAKSGAVVKANGNSVTGCSAASAGVGTFKRANNTWAGVDD